MPRFPPPERLLGAGDFSGERRLFDPTWLYRTLVDLPRVGGLDDVWPLLVNATFELESGAGRTRDRGNYILAYLCFTDSGYVDIEPWWARARHDPIWSLAGFDEPPSYWKVYRHFPELWRMHEAIREATGMLVRHAHAHLSAIGRYVLQDGTEAETHAAIIHACQPGSGCPWLEEDARSPGRRPRRTQTLNAADSRRQESAGPELEHEGLLIGDAETMTFDAQGRIVITTSGGHRFISRDSTAGVRMYDGTRGGVTFWHGFLDRKTVEYTTGLRLVSQFVSVQEHVLHADIVERIISTTGIPPLAFSADRGLSYPSVYEYNSRHGIATVIPYRLRGAEAFRQDHDEWDRHGIPRCRGCGGPTEFVRFTDRPEPRLWVRCAFAAAGRAPECGGEQTHFCSKDWKMLLPLWRTEPVYLTLRRAQEQYERLHRHTRDRFQVAGKDVQRRPKRIGIEWQQLRADASVFLGWLRLCARQGWLLEEATNPTVLDSDLHHGEDAAARLAAIRDSARLTGCYGTQAERLGVGEATPTVAPRAPAAYNTDANETSTSAGRPERERGNARTRWEQLTDAAVPLRL